MYVYIGQELVLVEHEYIVSLHSCEDSFIWVLDDCPDCGEAFALQEFAFFDDGFHDVAPQHSVLELGKNVLPVLSVEGEGGGVGPLGEVVPPELQDKEAARDPALSVRERDRRKDVEILLHINGASVNLPFSGQRWNEKGKGDGLKTMGGCDIVRTDA